MIIAINNEQGPPLAVPLYYKGVLHANKCVVCEIYYTTDENTQRNRSWAVPFGTVRNHLWAVPTLTHAK